MMKMINYRIPALIVLISTAYMALQLFLFEVVTEVETPSIIVEGIVAFLIAIGLFITEKVKSERKIYIPFILGTTFLYFYALTDVLDEFVEPPHYITYICEDFFQVLGFAFMIAAFFKWFAHRKQTEKVTRESEERFRTQFEEALDAIFIADAETGILIDCNQEAEKLVGRKKSEIVGKHQRILHPPEDIVGTFNKTFKKHLKEKEGIPLETKVITKKKEIRDVSIKANLMEINERKVLQGIFRDITERKKAEEEIRKKSKELETALMEKNLLLKEVHHRVKNNMHTISSILNLQTSSLKNKEAVEKLRMCQDRIKSMALVHEMLYQTENFQGINFKDFTKTLVESLFDSNLSDKDKIVMEMDIEDTFFDIDTSIPLALIINELVTNSFKYAFQGEIYGKISISLKKNNKDETEFKVKDTGVGLPEDFDINKTESLGLNMVKILAEQQLKGTLNINGNQGTEFQITFPKKH